MVAPGRGGEERRLVDEWSMRRLGKNSPASGTITEFYSKGSPFDLADERDCLMSSVESIGLL